MISAGASAMSAAATSAPARPPSLPVRLRVISRPSHAMRTMLKVLSVAEKARSATVETPSNRHQAMSSR